MDGVDPFEWIEKQCQVTSSQEEKLRSCRFAGESESMSDSESLTSPEKTEIVMLSVPGSDCSDLSTPPENDVFQTPPEHANSQSSNTEDQVLQPPKSDGVDSQFQSLKKPEDLAIIPYYPRTLWAVDLGKDSDCLGFSEPQSGQMVVGGNSGCELREGLDDARLNHRRAGTVETIKVSFKKMKVSEENFHLHSSTICEDDNELVSEDVKTQNAETEVVDIELIEREEESESGANSNNLKSGVQFPKNARSSKEGKRKSVSRNNGEIEKFKYKGLDGNDVPGSKKFYTHIEKEVTRRNGQKTSEDGKGSSLTKERITTSEAGAKNCQVYSGSKCTENVKCSDTASKGVDGTMGRKRELPMSMKAVERPPVKSNIKTTGKQVGASVAKDGFLNDIIDCVKGMVGEGVGTRGEPVDFLETAKRKGMTFPKPRWWPPEGFED